MQLKLKSSYVWVLLVLAVLLLGVFTVKAFDSKSLDVLGIQDREIAHVYAASDDFVITVKTDNPGASSDTEFIIPADGGGGYDFNVDCDNNGVDEITGQSGSYTCNYASAGTYTIRIKDNTGFGEGFPGVQFSEGGDQQKLLSVNQWGTGAWEDMNSTFSGCTNLNGTASDTPDLSGVYDMAWMFEGATSFNGDITGWDVSSVEDMSYMFSGASAFNGDVSIWDTSSVDSFFGTFADATSFNQDISGWDVSSVEDMNEMFLGASAFNQDISGWEVSSVDNMYAMFADATSFDQDLGAWDVSNVTDMYQMFEGVTLSTSNYDGILNGWNSLILQSFVDFSGGNSTYCAGATARTTIIDDYSWNISDGGEDCAVPSSPDDFIITVKTDNVGDSTDTQFTIPTEGVGYNYNIDCDDDGSLEATGQIGDYTCNYGVAGTYTVRIIDNTGTNNGFPRIYFAGASGGDRLKILEVNQWGINGWTSMSGAFQGAANLVITAIDVPDLSLVTELTSIFNGATNFNSNINNWDVTSVQDMDSAFKDAPNFDQPLNNWDVTNAQYLRYMFWGASSFNQDITGWDVSGVTDFSGMFANATNFNQDIGIWDVNGNTRTYGMFYFASSFNQDISGWDVSLVPSMVAMFRGASAFNQNISTWNTGSVEYMGSMFRDATSFNQDISGWDTSSLIDAGQMFEGATSFDQNLGSWDVEAVELLDGMFAGVTLSEENYDLILIGWSTQSLMENVPFDGGNSTYCAGAAARTSIIDDYTWTITDGGNNCPTPTPTPTGTPVPTSTPTPTPTGTPVPTSTPTPTPTGTPVPTSTPTPTPSNTPIPTTTPTVIATSTPVPTDVPVVTYNTPVPTSTPTPTDIPCDPADPLAECMQIYNVAVVVGKEYNTAAIFWSTDIDTIGNITYYKNGAVDGLSTELETVYKSVHHKQILANLEANANYNFTITSTSTEGFTDSYTGTFDTLYFDTLPETGACTDILSYEYNNVKNRIDINFATVGISTCTSYRGDAIDNYERISTSKSATNHDLAIDAEKDFATMPIYIVCKNDLTSDIGCSENIIITTKALPEQVDDSINYLVLDMSNDIVSIPDVTTAPGANKIGKILSQSIVSLPIVSLMPLTGLIGTVLVVYPSWRKIGFLWLHRVKKRKIWGVIYDKKNVKPIPFATIRLLHGDSVVTEVVSDLDGKYGIIAAMGKYVLSVHHPKYTAFKTTVSISKTGVVTKDIALQYKYAGDSIKEKTIRFIETNFKKLNILLATIGFIYTVVISISSPNWINYSLLAIYMVQLIINFIIWINNNKKEWGTVYDSQNKASIAGLFIRVFSKEEGRQTDVFISDRDGRYRFELDPGEYRVLVSGSDYEIDINRIEEKNRYVSPIGQEFLKYVAEEKQIFNADIPVTKHSVL